LGKRIKKPGTGVKSAWKAAFHAFRVLGIAEISFSTAFDIVPDFIPVAIVLDNPVVIVAFISA
jgi:hypothetical protein